MDEPEKDRRRERGTAGGPQSPAALEICRGVMRLMAAHGAVAISELPLPNGRRADVVSLSRDGLITIVEIKSSIEDFRADQKWHEYLEYCDRFLFAVAVGFPTEILPPDTGLILADRFGGEVVKESPEARLSGARRKAVTMRFARAAAMRLAILHDPTLVMGEI